MPQETTGEFALRLQQAVEAHPLSPPTPHGRQRWLLRKLESEAGLELSPNTIHKWMTGASRPRGDNIRKLATVLSVDEVWLSLGRKPVADGPSPEAAASRANGTALVVAGLIEMEGGRVTFADADDAAHLHVNMAGKNMDIIAVVPQGVHGEQITFLVPEPAGDARIFGVMTPKGSACSACVNLIDLSDIPRTNLGGFSTVTIESRRGGKFKVEGERNLRAPAPSLADLVS